MTSTATQPPVFAPDELILLICQHRGTLTHAQLLVAGFRDSTITTWLQQGVLVQTLAHHYELAEPDVYIDWLLQALWHVPDGIIGHLTALEYYGISVAWIREVDIGVQHPPVPMARIHQFEVPTTLWQYGVTTIYPSLPGPIAVPMYTPPVALAQVLADPTCDIESAADAVQRYISEYGLDEDLHEAAVRYGIWERLNDMAHVQV